MKVTYTDAGTPIIERTKGEEEAYLERETQAAIGMSVKEFTDAYLDGKLEDGDVAVDYLVAKLRIGQNGQKAVV